MTSFRPLTHGSSEQPIVLCLECGKKVRLGVDGWGYCRACKKEFNGKDAWEVPQC